MSVIDLFSRALVLFLLIASATGVSAQEKADLQSMSDSRLLSMIARECHENLSQIETWRCSASVVDITTGPTEDSRVEGKVSFFYDRSLRAKRYESEHTTIYCRNKGQEGRQTDRSMSGLMVGDTCLEVTKFGDEKRWIKIVDRLSIDSSSDLLDGFHFFSDQGEPARHRWNAIASRVADPSSIWKATRLGHQVLIAAESNSYAISMNEGCNITRYVSEVQDFKYTETRQYREVKGIWVPDRIVISRLFRGNPKGYEKKRREIKFTSHEINESLDAKLFTRAALNVLPKDRIIDSRTRQSSNRQ